jgi:hypothetical protein
MVVGVRVSSPMRTNGQFAHARLIHVFSNLEFVFPGKLPGVVFTRNAVVQVAWVCSVGVTK